MILDLETAPDPTVLSLLPPLEPPGNYSKPESIAKWLAENEPLRISKLALDPDCGRIVAIGRTLDDGTVHVDTCPDPASEAAAIDTIWREWMGGPIIKTLVGYNVLAFDVPFLIQRSRILRVEHPRISSRKYGMPNVVDLMMELTHGGILTPKKLSFWVSRFGIDVPDTITGKDIPALIEAGDWGAVREHCEADVRRTQILADALGFGH